MRKRIFVKPDSANIDSKQKALLVARFAKDKQAEDLVVLDICAISNFCDFFVILSAGSTKKAKAIADSVEQGLKLKNIKLNHSEGKAEGLWILLDYFDVIVHIFLEELRPFYNLEHLWLEAKRLEV